MQAQPYDVHAPVTDATLVGAWLGKTVRGVALGADASPAGDDMTPVNATDIIAKSVGADFGGTNGYLRRPEVDWRSGDSAGTIKAWVKVDAAHNGAIFASCDEGGNQNVFYLAVNLNLALHIYAKSGGVMNRVNSPNDSLVVGVWHRVALVSTGTAWLLYIDGFLKTLTPVGAEANTGDWLADVPSRDNVTIGARRYNVIDTYFNGQIKDARYYSRPLSAGEILFDYLQGVPDSSLAFWTVGGMTDLTRYCLPLTLWNGPVAGHEMSFDGTNQSLETTAVELLTGAACSFWFNARADEEAVLFNDVPHADRRLVVNTYAGGELRAGYWQGAVYRAASGTGYQINRWHHIYCSTDTDDTCRLWLDGTELTGAVDPSSGNGINLRLGASSSGSGNFDGRIRDVRLWQADKGEAFGQLLYAAQRKYY